MIIKIAYSLLILFFLNSNAHCQTDEQQKRADAYYQNVESIDEKSQVWDWLSGGNSGDASIQNRTLIKEEYSNGSWYAGQAYAGYGTTQFGDGTIYSGRKDYNGLQNGIGVTEWTNGDRYMGHYINGKANGLGIAITFRVVHIGGFKNNQNDGFVISKWSTPILYNDSDTLGVTKYVGEYKESEWHGFGIAYFEDGTYKSGVWIEGILSKELEKMEVLEALGF